MNKKLLSTVMAGTMLATSVAPVFAEYDVDKTSPERKEVGLEDKEVLKNKLIDVMMNTYYASFPGSTKVNNGTVYEIRCNGKEIHAQIGNKDSVETMLKNIDEIFNNVNKDTVITLVDRGHVKSNGRYYDSYLVDTPKSKNYTKESLKQEKKDFEAKKFNKDIISNIEENQDGSITVKLNNNNTINLKVGDVDLDLSRPLNSNGNVITNIKDFDHFDTKIVFYQDYTLGTDAALELIEAKTKGKFEKIAKIEYPQKIGTDGQPELDQDGKEVKDKLNLSITLADGYLFSDKKDALYSDTISSQSPDNKTRVYSLLSKPKVPDLDKLVLDNNNNTVKGFETYKKETFKGQRGDRIDGKYVAEIHFVDGKTQGNGLDFSEWIPKPDPVYPIIPDNKPIKPDNKPTIKPIETIAGEDRYDTAIEVAKEIAPVKEIAENGSVVLVNGNALVDGLAAAPLASSVSTTNKVKAAPILLTKTDKLTTSTKDYIEELVSQKKSLGAGKLRVYIVGGEAVVSKDVEKELSDLGVEIIRAGGKNREETSLKVADLMSEKQKSSNAFVVGADGEADAMSIASIAASRKEPIIVSRKGGLSKSAIEKMASLKNTSATIIGGDKVVSANTEKSLKEANINSDRVAGVNRQDTNAKIINRYASSRLDKVLVSKDGQNKKDELVDALTATSLAVKYNAPIVLATNKISDAQIKAIKDNADTKGISISQIGHGIAESVINTIAEKVGLIK